MFLATNKGKSQGKSDDFCSCIGYESWHTRVHHTDSTKAQTLNTHTGRYAMVSIEYLCVYHRGLSKSLSQICPSLY